MTWIIEQIIALGFPEKYAKAALIGFGVVALAVAALAFKISYDRSVIVKHDAKVEKKVEAKTAKVDAQIDKQHAADAALQASENNSIQKVIENAPHSTSPASTVRQRYYECLRLWQSRHPSSSATPTC